MNTETNINKKIEQLVKQSFMAASVVAKNKETIETLVSIHQIKSGNYKTYTGVEDMFQKLHI